MELRSKLWLEINGEAIFGEGRSCLLEAIEKHGSINRAARELNMPYRKAWCNLAVMEKRLGMKLIERRTGGRSGGGAALTKEAIDFLDKFRKLEDGLREFADARFRTIFCS